MRTNGLVRHCDVITDWRTLVELCVCLLVDITYTLEKKIIFLRLSPSARSLTSESCRRTFPNNHSVWSEAWPGVWQILWNGKNYAEQFHLQIQYSKAFERSGIVRDSVTGSVNSFVQENIVFWRNMYYLLTHSLHGAGYYLKSW